MGRREISNKNLMWSVAALVLVLLLIPVVLGGLNAMNDAYAAGYVDVYHATPPQKVSSSTWDPLKTAVDFRYNNATASPYLDLSSSTFSVDNETYTETIIFSAPSDYVSAYELYTQYNQSVEYLYNNSVDRLHVQFAAGNANGNLIFKVYAFDAGSTTTTISTLVSKNLTVVNGTVDDYVDISTGQFLSCISASSGYTDAKLYIWVQFDNYTLSDGDEIDFAYTFEKQRGVSESAMTPYIVGGLGGLLLVSAVAATDVVDPLASRNKIHLWKRKSSHRRRKRRW